MLRIWSEEPPYEIDGEFYTTRSGASFNPDIGLGVAVRPLQQPHPPIAITSIRASGAGPRAAGNRGWTGISATYVGRHVVRAHIEGYREGRRAAALSSSTSGWRVARSIFVADDDATARSFAYRRDGPHAFYFRVMQAKLASGGALDVMLDDPSQPASQLGLERCLERLVITGTPRSVAEQILRFREEVGAFGTLLYTGHDWVEPELARRSMELMAREVMPRVNQALAVD